MVNLGYVVPVKGTNRHIETVMPVSTQIPPGDVASCPAPCLYSRMPP
jgi:hypothetical protein